MLYHAHSGLRYLVLLAGLIAVLYYAAAYFGRRPAERMGRVLMSTFVGFLDIQILLGLALVLLGIYYPALIGHIVMMVLAAVAAHAASVVARRAPEVRRAHGIRLVGVAGSLLLIVGGIMAIGRSVFGATAPSLTL